MKIVLLCCAYAQDRFLYRVDGVDSNDLLYGGTRDYHESLLDIVEENMSEITNIIAVLKKEEGIIVSSFFFQCLMLIISSFFPIIKTYSEGTLEKSCYE